MTLYACGMKRFAPFLLLLCGCVEDAPPDAEKIVGEWVVMDFRSPMAAEDRGQRRKFAVVTEGTWSQQFQGSTFEDFEYALNPSTAPKQIDLTYTASNGKRLKIRGIYELSRDDISDQLVVCFGSPPVVDRNGKAEYAESVRPTAFGPTTGPLIRFRRKSE